MTVLSLWRSVRRRWLGYVAAVAAVVVVSGFIGLVLRQVNLANVSMLYLLAVLATAVAYGRGPAVFASIVAFLTFDWFFVEPLHHFTVSDPEEWVSLLLFLMTAIVTGQLAAGQRQRAREAQQREREAVSFALSASRTSRPLCGPSPSVCLKSSDWKGRRSKSCRRTVVLSAWRLGKTKH